MWAHLFFGGISIGIQESMMKTSALMYQDNFKCFKVKSSMTDTMKCLVPSSTCDESIANESYYKSLVKREWESFDGFIGHGFQKFSIVEVSKSSWNQKSICTCTSFFKQNICKHIIAVGLREGLFKCPDTANPTVFTRIGRKPGRAENAKKALQHQWFIQWRFFSLTFINII